MKHSNKLSLLHYNMAVVEKPNSTPSRLEKAVPMSIPSKKKNQSESIDNHGGHLPDYKTMRKRCMYCAMEDKENRKFVICLACNIPLCSVKERNCFQKDHI